MVEEILDRLDIKITSRGSSCVYASTQYRGGDAINALVINNNGWCHDLVTGENLHITEVASIKLGVSIEKAREIIGSTAEIEVEEPEPEVKLVKTLPESYFADLIPSFSFYTLRGLKKDTLMFFKAGFAMGGRNYGRIVFPIYHKSGQIRGAVARCVMKDHEEKRKLDPNYKRAKWVKVLKSSEWDYPYFFVKGYIKAAREIIIVESVGDLLSLFDAGIKNVLVLFGLNLSDELLLTIIAANPRRILLGLNNDLDKEQNRGQNANKKIQAKLGKFFSADKIVIAPPESGDFGDYSNNKKGIWEWAAKYGVEKSS